MNSVVEARQVLDSSKDGDLRQKSLRIRFSEKALYANGLSFSCITSCHSSRSTRYTHEPYTSRRRRPCPHKEDCRSCWKLSSVSVGSQILQRLSTIDWLRLGIVWSPRILRVSRARSHYRLSPDVCSVLPSDRAFHLLYCSNCGYTAGCRYCCLGSWLVDDRILGVRGRR